MLKSIESPRDQKEIALQCILSPAFLLFPRELSLTIEVSVSMVYDSYYFSPDPNSKTLRQNSLILTQG